jgi:hypothetical protein
MERSYLPGMCEGCHGVQAKISSLALQIIADLVEAELALAGIAKN